MFMVIVDKMQSTRKVKILETTGEKESTKNVRNGSMKNLIGVNKTSQSVRISMIL